MRVSTIEFKKPVSLFEGTRYEGEYKEVIIGIIRHNNDHTKNVGCMFMTASKIGNIFEGELGEYGDEECVEYIRKRVPLEDIKKVKIYTREYAIGSYRLRGMI